MEAQVLTDQEVGREGSVGFRVLAWSGLCCSLAELFRPVMNLPGRSLMWTTAKAVNFVFPKDHLDSFFKPSSPQNPH